MTDEGETRRDETTAARPRPPIAAAPATATSRAAAQTGPAMVSVAPARRIRFSRNAFESSRSHRRPIGSLVPTHHCSFINRPFVGRLPTSFFNRTLQCFHHLFSWRSFYYQYLFTSLSNVGRYDYFELFTYLFIT